MYTIAFTGHRPDKLGGYDWSTPINQRIGVAMKLAILKEMRSLDEKDFTFYFGGALGVDQMAFEIVDFIQKQHPEWNITKIMCVPFETQACKWVAESRLKYNEQLSKSDKIIYVDDEEGYKMPTVKLGMYHPSKMQRRNMYMVDHSQTLIAVYNGSESGGTANCVNYAKRLEKNIVYVDPSKYF